MKSTCRRRGAVREAASHLVRTRQLQLQTQELLDGSHGDSAGAADEPLHQVLNRRQSSVTTSLQRDAKAAPVKNAHTHRHAVLPRLPRVPQAVQTDGDLRVAPVVVLVAAFVAVIAGALAVVASDVGQREPLTPQAFCTQTKKSLC